MWQLAASLWHQLSAAEQAEWERLGTARHMTGFAWYMSQALRPNPGIYLPLAGGTMSGDIAMADNQLTGLIDPVTDDQAARKAYVDMQIGGFTQNVRARRTTTQSITSGSNDAITFDLQDFDSDSMWEGVVNPSRITINTAGVYLVMATAQMQAHATGNRAIWIQLNDTDILCITWQSPAVSQEWRATVSTIFALAVTDFIKLRVYQNSGVNLTVNPQPPSSITLSAVRVGP